MSTKHYGPGRAKMCVYIFCVKVYITLGDMHNILFSYFGSCVPLEKAGTFEPAPGSRAASLIEAAEIPVQLI